ncbi:MAG: bifunctional nuclease family protein [Chloroflexi bacterium]|nr:bifunctional nuclease family protein [Chloroflexota bacterium]
MADLVEATIDSIRMSLTSQQRIIILKDIKQERYLPIWIGPYESESISIALQEIEISRPQTHDLIKDAIIELGGSITRIIINELKDDIFYGVIEIVQKNKKIQLDTRPSDALALAVRTHVPIFIADDIMLSASIVPVEEEYVSKEIDQNENPITAAENSSVDMKEEIDSDRLSVFEEYLKNLDIDNDLSDNNGISDEEEPYDDEDDDEDEDDYPDGNINAI